MQSGLTNETLLVLSCVLWVHSLKVIDLGGKWICRNSRTEKHVTATVPGGIYTDLMDNGVIQNIIVGDQDIKSRWVAKRNWTYSKTFTVSRNFLNHANIKIVFDGVDTFSSIFLNGEWIGDTENMFVQYIFDVQEQIKLGGNVLQVNFTSPITKANQLANEYGANTSKASNCCSGNVNYIRKMQASFGWDWVPAFPSMGIWKPVHVEAFSATVLREIVINITSEALRNLWHLNITVYMDSTKANEIKANLIFHLRTDLDIVRRIYKVTPTKLPNGELIQNVLFTVAKSKVQLWWPNGYGEPKLYALEVTYNGTKDKSRKTFKIGFRTVEVMVKNIMSDLTDSTYFYIKINEVPIFVKGTNVFLLDILPEKNQDVNTAKFLLKSAKETHVNMIRVWGSGIYQSNEFYDLADELGLLIWQDFMLSCAVYRAETAFLKTVREEVRYQVKRLQRHPSIVLWAAVNDKEISIYHAWNARTEDYYFNAANFAALYIDTIEAETLKIDRTRRIITSLPVHEFLIPADGYIHRYYEYVCVGDVYFDNYIKTNWDGNRYPLPMTRYPIEAGFLSLPSLSTLLTATNNTNDLKYGSSFLEHRKYVEVHIQDMRIMISRELNLPKSDHINYYKAFIYYSQITQALLLKAYTELYRIWRNNLSNRKEGVVMGYVYYMLNDVWIAPTWSAIDYKKKWKMLQYFTKNFNAPVIIAGRVDTTTWQCSIYIVSDLQKNIENVTAALSVYKWKAIEVMHVKKYSTNIPASRATLLTKIRLNNLLSEANCGGRSRSTEKCFLVLSLHDEDDQLIAPENFIFPTALKEVDMRTATVTIASVKQMGKSREFKIEISTNEIALFVWLDVNGVVGIFSENGFVMVIKTKFVYFRSQRNTTETNVKENLSVTHLKDSEYFDAV